LKLTIRQVESETPRKPARHVGIAAEVAVNSAVILLLTLIVFGAPGGQEFIYFDF
jgi:hypothetical protein